MIAALLIALWLSMAVAAAGWIAFGGERRDHLHAEAAFDRELRRTESAHDRERVTWQAQLDVLAKSIHYGAPGTTEAVVTEPEPTAEERATRAFGQEAIENGIRRLREEYSKLGVSPSELPDDALRDEAISILYGGTPRPSVPLLVRDG